MPADDIIYALATAPGRSGVAVIRVSGRHLGPTFRGLRLDAPPPRQAMLRDFRDPDGGGSIDRGLLLYFPSPTSFTGEDVIELHLHGSRAVITEMLAVLGRLPGHRIAEPGEFTRRAFENGKLDLAEAEGLADLIDAETAAQKRQALRQMEGALSVIASVLRDGLLRSLAYLEALIDFPDEDIPEETLAEIDQELAVVQGQIAGWLASARYGECVRDGFRVTILGAPNVGKSTLLNALARREVAIVSPQAGTTRDRIEVKLDIGGLPVWLSDTAGIRESDDPIEQEGMRRALDHAATSDLRILLLEGNEPKETCCRLRSKLSDTDIVAYGKSDLNKLLDRSQAEPVFSAITGDGLDRLLETLHKRLSMTENSDSPVLTRARHRQAFETAQSMVIQARQAPELEMKAEEVRHAAIALSSIVGGINIDDLLDVVFSSFCLGK